jgi:ABC-2 type transport system permease protein/ribosome-dependent ATPase
MKLQRILTLARKETREILRDRLYAMLAFLLPCMLLVVFTYGMTGDVENIGLAVVDEDQTQASRAYTQQFLATRHFHLVAASPDAALIDQVLSNRQARVVLWIGPDFERNLMAQRPIEVAAQIDGSRTTPARTIRAYLEAINAQANAGYRLRAAVAQAAPTVRLETRFLYNPQVRSVVFIAPSLIMTVLMLVPPLLIAVSIVREKETGAIYNIASSTVTRMEFLLGKMLPVVAICMVDAVVLWLIVGVYFDVPFRGSLIELAFAVLLYILATASLGLLVSTAVRTQQAAIIITAITALIVAISYSGFFAPLDTADPANRFVARLFPAGYFLPVLRAMYLKGSGIAEYWRELFTLALYSAVVLGLAHTLFHKWTKS